MKILNNISFKRRNVKVNFNHSAVAISVNSNLQSVTSNSQSVTSDNS